MKTNGDIAYRKLLALYHTQGVAGLRQHSTDPTVFAHARARDGRTIAFDIVQADDAPGVKWLTKIQMPLTDVDAMGWSLLHVAAAHHAVRAAELLLKAGVPIDAADRFGNTPLAQATFESRGRGEMIRLLLSHGANRNLRNASGVSPLGLAKSIANYSVAEFFK